MRTTRFTTDDGFEFETTHGNDNSITCTCRREACDTAQITVRRKDGLPLGPCILELCEMMARTVCAAPMHAAERRARRERREQ